MLVLLIYEYLSLCKSSDDKMLGICIVALESHRDVQGISQRDGQHTSSEIEQVMDYQPLGIVRRDIFQIAVTRQYLFHLYM